jgi:hypothetical protein
MTKGNQGESCAEAIRFSLERGEVVTSSELYRRIKQKGSWKDETVWQHMMGLIVNLPTARQHWKSMQPFLFLHGDGKYELYNPEKHPKTVE